MQEVPTQSKPLGFFSFYGNAILGALKKGKTVIAILLAGAGAGWVPKILSLFVSGESLRDIFSLSIVRYSIEHPYRFCGWCTGVAMLCYLIWAPYAFYRSNVQQNESVMDAEKTARLKDLRDHANTVNLLRAELQKCNEQLDQRAKRATEKSVKEMEVVVLARLLDEGRKIQDTVQQFGMQQLDSANQWARKCEDNLGKIFGFTAEVAIARFRSSAGMLPLGLVGFAPDSEQLFNAMNARCIRLQEFISEHNREISQLT